MSRHLLVLAMLSCPLMGGCGDDPPTPPPAPALPPEAPPAPRPNTDRRDPPTLPELLNQRQPRTRTT